MLSNFNYSILLLTLFFISWTKNQPMREYKISGQAQGTTYAASYFATDSLVTKSQIDSILNVVDLSMSLYKPNSTISKFNAMPAGKIKVDPHMNIVLKKSFQINKETDGFFDITIQPLMRLWGFYRAQAQKNLPDTNKINALLKTSIGMNKIKLKRKSLSKQNRSIEIDLNGIAQGYAVDVVADFVASKGIKSYVFELGGEIRAKGPKPDGSQIKIGIEGPTTNEFENPDMKHIISFKQGAVTTSGSYRKYISFNGKNYGHIINPKTSYPINNGIISVTIFAEKAIDADGYDNALMLMPVQKAIKFVESKKNLEAYIIYKKTDGTVTDTLTAGFKQMIVK
ncbi:FAD:protein FMN transferase [Pedobacter cryotolerans]|uniref:FAD:protein FMN transferase n=2 Tax=Pedobacter cryotolerans TaxID=2571270 RepID=A0A4U1C862_9SPHI|nr:FAD:protein FMN transferase [Pedobacter cryotolerans]